MDPGGDIHNDGNKLSWSVLRYYYHILLEGLRNITKKQRIIGVLVEIRPASSQVGDICSNLSRPVSRNNFRSWRYSDWITKLDVYFTGHNALRIETNVDVRMSAVYCSSAVQLVEVHIQYMTLCHCL